MAENEYKLPQVKVCLCLKEAPALYSSKAIMSKDDAVRLISEELKEQDREHLYVINLNTKGIPISYEVVSVGDLSTSIVAVSNVYKSAILSNAASIILAHNHPSGTLIPNKMDEDVTKRVAAAGKLMGIQLLDHIIVSGYEGNVYSFREEQPELF